MAYLAESLQDLDDIDLLTTESGEASDYSTTDLSTGLPGNAESSDFTEFIFTSAGLTGPRGPNLAELFIAYNELLPRNPWINDINCFNVTENG